MFSLSIGFSVSDFTWRSLIHLDLVFVQGDRSGSNFILLHVDFKFSEHYLLGILSFHHLHLCQINNLAVIALRTVFYSSAPHLVDVCVVPIFLTHINDDAVNTHM